MTRKMIVQGIGVLGIGMLVISACQRRSYVAPGLRGEFDFSGSYRVQAQAVTSSCPSVSANSEESRLDVEHSPGQMEVTIVFEGDPYPSQVKRSGQFASVSVQRGREGATEHATLRGKFRDSTVTASLEVRRAAVRTVLPTSQSRSPGPCGYHVDISGVRVADRAGATVK